MVLAVPAAARDEGPGPPPWRIGGRLGLTVDAATFPDSAGYLLEIYVRIPPGTLAALGRDPQGATRLRVTVRLRNVYGARQHEAVQEFGIDPSDTTGGFGKVVMMRFPARPGPEHVRVAIEDLNLRRSDIGSVARALWTRRQRAHPSNSVEGDIDLPAPQAGRDLSDLEFVWHEGPVQRPSAFRRGERTVLPNPERLYGLYASELRAYFRARAGDERSWHWVARVLDHGGNLVAQQESTAAAARALQAWVSLDLTHEPAGGYDLEVKAWQEGDAGALLRRAHFSLAWKGETWLRNPRDIEDNVHFLLGADDEEAFARLQPGEQERFLDDFWRARDPTTDTARNEALDTFLERVAYADRMFGQAGRVKGIFSDMGRVYVRYGAPGEVYHQVIPAGSETLGEVVRELSLTEERPVGDLNTQAPVGDLRPWEVWVYEGDIPLPPDADPQVAPGQHGKRRLVFLFVDEHGLGDYRLRYSTE